MREKEENVYQNSDKQRHTCNLDRREAVNQHMRAERERERERRRRGREKMSRVTLDDNMYIQQWRGNECYGWAKVTLKMLRAFLAAS